MTKRERNKVYRKMLDLYETNGFDYGAGIFKGLTRCAEWVGIKRGFAKQLPELVSIYTSKGFTNLWYEEGYLIRVMALLECIKETN